MYNRQVTFTILTLLQQCLATLGPIIVYIYFKIKSSSNHKNSLELFIGNTLNSYINLGSIDIFILHFHTIKDTYPHCLGFL